MYIITPGDDLQNIVLMKYLGPSFDIGEEMCGKDLNSTGYVFCRTLIFPIKDAAMRTDEFKAKSAKFTAELETNVSNRDPRDDNGFMCEDESPQDRISQYDFLDEEARIPEADNMDYDAYGKYISMRVSMLSENQQKYGTVKRRKTNNNGESIRKYNSNSELNTVVYEVMFDNGSPPQMITANIIAQNIFQEIKDQGYYMMCLKDLISCKKKEDAVNPQDGEDVYFKTTKDWLSCATYADMSFSGGKLNDTKESNPVEVKYIKFLFILRLTIKYTK